MKLIKRIVVGFMSLTMLLGAVAVSAQNGEVKAAKKPAVPGNVKVTEGNYYKYWEKHEKELKKAGKYQGDGADAGVSWSGVSGADGYRVVVVWDGEMGVEQSIVEVKKENNKYSFEAKSIKKDGRDLAKSAKDYIYNGSKKIIKSSKLSFYMDGKGSCVSVKKVKVKSYKLVKGKRVYSKYATAYPKK